MEFNTLYFKLYYALIVTIYRGNSDGNSAKKRKLMEISKKRSDQLNAQNESR